MLAATALAQTSSCSGALVLCWSSPAHLQRCTLSLVFRPGFSRAALNVRRLTPSTTATHRRLHHLEGSKGPQTRRHAFQLMQERNLHPAAL